MGYPHPLNIATINWDEYARNSDGFPYNKAAWCITDTFEGYPHQATIDTENYTEFAKDEDGYPYNNAVWKYNTKNHGYPYIMEVEDFPGYTRNNSNAWKFNENNNGYPYSTNLTEPDYFRYTKNKRKYPAMDNTFKYNAFNNGYPWVVGYEIIHEDLVMVLLNNELAGKKIYQETFETAAKTQETHLQYAFFKSNKKFK